MPNEPRVTGLRRLLRIPGRAVEKDVDEELAFHIESRVRDLVAQGMSAAGARAAAEAEFGDLGASRRELAAVDRHRRRRERIANWIDTIAQDLQHAARSLGRARAFTATAAITLVLGVGALVAMFAVIDAVLVRPLPFPDADRLIGAWHDMPPISLYHTVQSAGTFFTYGSEARTIDGIGVYEQEELNIGDDRSGNAPQRVLDASSSASLFGVLRVPAERGRVLGEADDRPGAPPVVIISDALWHSRFGADPDIVGKPLDVNGVRREVVGVMPPSFRFPSPQTQIWIPLALDPRHIPPTAFNYTGVARLKPGVTIADATRDFTNALPRVVDLYPDFVPGITTRQIMDQTKPYPVLTHLAEDVTGTIAGTLWMMGGAALLLWIVACVNVATLALVRFDARQREIAVREALGAGRGRVLRYQFSESALLSVSSSVVGGLLAWVAVRLLVRFGPADLPRLAEIGMDGRVVAFAVGLTLVAAMLFTVLPAMRILTGHVALREGARGATASRHQQRVRGTLVAAQIALGIVALTASGLLLRSFAELRNVRPGFDGDHVATLWLSLPQPRYPKPPDIVRFYAALVGRVSVLPGVKSVGITARLPLEMRGVNENPLSPEGAPEWGTKLPPLQFFTSIGGDYFGTLHIPIIAGRGFEPLATQHENEALVSRRTAIAFWHDSTGAEALGKRFRPLPTGKLYTVVGVVADVRDTSLAASPSGIVYFPELVQRDSVLSHKTRTMALAVRTSGDPASIFPALERVVHDLDPSLPTFDARTMTAVSAAATSRLAFTTLILGAAAAVTVVLGAVGLYGVLAYIVALRRREFGIRIALGASPARVAAATTRHGLLLAGAGALVGLALLAVVARAMRTFLFGVTPWDPLAVTGSTALLLAIAVVASWIPARRASRVDPTEALRAD